MKTSFSLRFSFCLGLLLLTSPAATHGQDVNNLERTGEWQVVIEGAVPDDARLWFSQADAVFVLSTSKLPFPVLIDARSSAVIELDPSAIGAGELTRLPASARKDSVSKLVPGQGEALFSIKGTVARLRFNALEGESTAEDLYEHSPDYRTKAASYEPNATDLSALAAWNGKATVRIMFGTWCGVCKNYMPNLMGVAEKLTGSNIQFEYFGLPASNPWEHPEVSRLAIEELPTAVVFVDGKEAGRFAGADGFRQPEKMLSNALLGKN